MARSNSPGDQKPSVRRALQDDPTDDEDYLNILEELDADPATCRRECCMPPPELTFTCRICKREMGDFFYLPRPDCCMECWSLLDNEPDK